MILRKLLSPKRTVPSSPARQRIHALLPGVRVYAIGDVHGCDELLARMHERIRRHLVEAPAEEAHVVHLGDYVDRGIQSREVVERLIRADLGEATLHFLRGNHEAMLLDFLENPDVLNQWQLFGGVETLHSYGVECTRLHRQRNARAVRDEFMARFPRDHLAFLQNLKLNVVLDPYFFCHAGVRPGVPLDQQSADDLLWIRDEFLLNETDYDQIVVHGHTPTEEPEVRHNRINVDTGAFLSGRLTCVVLEGNKHAFLQIPE